MLEFPGPSPHSPLALATPTTRSLSPSPSSRSRLTHLTHPHYALALAPTLPSSLRRTHPHQARPLGRTDLELIFQRANIDTPARPASRSPPSKRSSPQRPTSPLEDQPLEGVEEDDDDGGDGGAAVLVIREFVCALVRVAWIAYPRQRGVEAKMRLLLEGGLTPFWQAYEQQQEVGFDFEQVQAYGVGG